MTANRGTYDRFIEFRAAVMQAIALAWSDPDFRAKLIAHPKAALKDGVGYDFPFNIDLHVDPDSATWELQTLADWHLTTTNTLQMVLPPAPKPEHQVEALAWFNATHLTFLK